MKTILIVLKTTFLEFIISEFIILRATKLRVIRFEDNQNFSLSKLRAFFYYIENLSKLVINFPFLMKNHFVTCKHRFKRV